MASDAPRKPLGIDVSRSSMDSPPGIAALFVISFDIRAGYVVSWKRTAPGVEVEGVVEYKSLPSGLHNVTEDLVYFVHEEHAGISAFLNHPATEAERNAKMFAIGVLVPLSSGRLGKSWRHAPKLKELTLKYAANMSDMQPLSDYWDSFQIGGNETAVPDSPIDSPLSVRFPSGDRPSHRSRAFSDAMVLETSRPALTPFHPASSLPDFMDCFGPLIFPLYRAALLRKRILFMTEAPVHTPCNFVYDLSLLASLPNSLLQTLPVDRTPPLRPRPLFNIGIHDIPYLASFDVSRTSLDPENDPSWIACSTDSVLSMKPDLYDALVTLPPQYSQHATEHVFPKIILTTPTSTKNNSVQTVQLKATQRDARRFAMLRKGLRRFSSERSTSSETEDESDADSTYSSSPVVEPLSWTRLAYTSFIWWASAGENRDGLSEEEEEQQIEQDARLLASVESLAYPAHHSTGRRSLYSEDQRQEPPEVALVAYFRRLTTQIFFTLAGAIARHDNDDYAEDGAGDAYTDTPYLDNDPADDDAELSLSMSRQSFPGGDANSPLLRQRSHVNNTSRHGSNTTRDALDPDKPITITIADMAEMGLDVWSATDRIFAEELVSLWWGRSARVDSARIRCCGISVL
ncbi:uncharacterized protein N7459_007641 [Penicillium hispanicum]|uniref:uncharacterized protein n=1 Tax=Penicillium hispanicum TaxID=1080232 RepID=UPI00254168DE|nr:uncharacterized protein N7459_007641 [Penicillium hispanicum]KAJ5578677.1 hypothetical protein N7459_007641 [Penicillium hispanicum]